MDGPFIGSEAIRDGLVRKHQLRSHYTAVFPDVYVPEGQVLTLAGRAKAAWLWSHRSGILFGLTAAGLHGAKWIGDDLPVELIWSNARPPAGLVTQQIDLAAGERMVLRGLPVTTPLRTAFDVGRRPPMGSSVARMDALLRATGMSVADVEALAARHRGARGLRQLAAVLARVDPGAQSPKESWLRVLLVEAGLPTPRTQLPVRSSDGWSTYYLDMGWEDIMVAVEYDGDHHRTDRAQYARDVHRLEDLARLGWIVIRVLAGDTADHILRRVRDAVARRTPSLRTDRFGT
ncbi:hypothetical protein B1R94_06205 [Mycolicibacterium litorale]|nr:hypothetical protein B1R94_06205 [Mycolicibacterium litorale]